MKSIKKIPDIVYKYRSWKDKNEKKVLSNFQLYFTSPKDFNDPFDCRIPPNYKILNQFEINKIVDERVIRLSSSVPNFNEQVEKNKLINEITNDINAFQQKENEIMFSHFDTYYGVLSLSTTWKDILMWGHYGDKHQGYCVGFYEKALRKSQNFITFGLVSYPKSNSYPLIHPLKKFEPVSNLVNVHNKALGWRNENEYRLTKLFYPEIPTKESRQYNFNPNLIAEVIIGINTPKADRDKIIKICKLNNIKVYQAEKIEFKFKIDRKAI